MNVRAPKNVAQATALLERHALLEGQVARIEARRQTLLARANAAADAALTPLLEELTAIDAKLLPWWQSARGELAGKRKSIELGGCMIGTRAAAAKLAHSFETDDLAVEALRGSRYGKHTTRVKYSLDRPATLRLLKVGGRTAAAIGQLGFKVDEPGETFFVQRVDQGGTIGPDR